MKMGFPVWEALFLWRRLLLSNEMKETGHFASLHCSPMQPGLAVSLRYTARLCNLAKLNNYCFFGENYLGHFIHRKII